MRIFIIMIITDINKNKKLNKNYFKKKMKKKLDRKSSVFKRNNKKNSTHITVNYDKHK